MIKKTVDLSKHSLSSAKRISTQMKKDSPNTQFHFILPSANAKKTNPQDATKKIAVKCPICNSQLVSTEEAIVCSSSNIKLIIDDIKAAKKRYGDSAGLWLNKTAYRFLEQYEHDHEQLKCDFYEKKY